MEAMHQFASRISVGLIKFCNLPEAKIPVLTYGLEVVLSTLLSLAVLLLGGLLAGTPILVLTAAFTGAALRAVAGGVHASGPYFCAFFGGVVFTLIGLAAREAGIAVSLRLLLLIVALTGFAGFSMVSLYAPAGCARRPFTGKEEFLKKRRARYVVLSWTLLAGAVPALTLLWPDFLLQESIFLRQVLFASTLGLWWQLFTLTPVAYRLLPRLEKGAGRLLIRKEG
ncbi:MAG: accessory gene regulator B family protein [Bacillota bacterium]|nr:accessory gene regulator B family protein [Bacillota bacterium]